MGYRKGGKQSDVTHGICDDCLREHFPGMANKIIAVLKYPPLQMTLREHGNFEVRKLKWKDSALKCIQVYEDVMVQV